MKHEINIVQQDQLVDYVDADLYFTLRNQARDTADAVSETENPLDREGSGSAPRSNRRPPNDPEK